MTPLPGEREQARAARQNALGKLEKDVHRGAEVEQLTTRLGDLRRDNHFAEMIRESMRGKK